jgi:hypothetical protein
MILAQCGSCENQLKFPDDWIGKLIQCPNCGSMVELPAIAVAKPIRNSEKRIDVRPREITTESLIDIDVSNEQQTPKKNHGDCENDANQNDANHNDEIERTDTSDEYSVVSPTVANSQSPQPYENGFTPLNQPTADPYTGTPINVTPVPGTSYPAPSGIEAPLGAMPTFNQYQANKSVQAQPVQAQPVQAQPVQAQPVQAQPVQAQPVQAQPVQAQPVQAQPVQAQPVQAQPVPTKPVETAPIDVARSDAPKTSKPPLIKSGVAQKKSIEEHENRQADENPASQKEAVSTSSDTKHPPVSNKPHQSDSLTTTKDDKEEDSLTLLRDSPKSKLHDSGLLDGDQADDTLLLEKRPADDPATATPNTNTSRSQASEKPEKNFTKEAAEQKPNEPVLAAKRIQPQKEKPAENQGAAVPLDSIVKAPPNSKKEFAGQPVQPQPVQPQPVQPQPVQTQPVQATATPVQNDAGNDALPAIAKAVPIATASPPVIPAQEIAATTPVPSPQPTSPQPTNAKRSQLDKKPKFGEKKTIKLSPGAKKAVLYGSIGTALVVAVLLSLVFIQKMITSGPVRTFEAYKIAVKNNDFAALYDVVDSATRDTFDNYAEAKSKETPVDYSLRGKDKFVAVATKRFESTDAIKQKTIDSKLQLIEKATIVSESVNRNRASIQVRFEENATESITFEKVDGDWKIGVPTFSLLFIEY